MRVVTIANWSNGRSGQGVLRRCSVGIRMDREEAIRLQRSHAPKPRCGNGLPVDTVGHVASGEQPRYVRGRRARPDLDVTIGVEVHFSHQERTCWRMAYGNKNAINCNSLEGSASSVL